VKERSFNVNATRKTAVVTGVVFIIATVAALAAAALAPALTGADYLTGVAANADQVAASALMYLIAAFASAGIAVSL
jgi:type IV secretory pathway component VirB8